MAVRARHFLVSAVAGLLALACTLGPAISPAAAETATGAVVVHVRGSDGEPAVRVFVSTRNETGSDSPYGYTDESGSIRFDGLPEGRYQLSLRCYANCPTSYVAQTTDWFDVADGQHLERDVELALGASIDGRVIGDDGRALADALVRLHPMSTAPLPYFETSMRTGMDGRYRFTDLPAGDYTVEFLPGWNDDGDYHPQFWGESPDIDSAEVITVAEGGIATSVDAELASATWITVRVVDEDGLPHDVSNDMSVQLYREIEDGLWYEPNSIRTNVPGEVRFEGLHAGTFYVKVWTQQWGGMYGVGEWWQDAPDRASAQPIVAAEGERPTVTVVLEGGPVDLTGPVLSGIPRVGETLTATASSLTAEATLTYQWTADGVPIDGADATAFTPTASEIGKRLAVEVVAAAPDRIVRKGTSLPTVSVAPGLLTAPVPTVIGEAVVGKTLTVDPGAWTIGAELAYRWVRADTTVATGAELVLTPDLAGSAVAIEVSGTMPGYTTVTRRSDATPRIMYGTVDLNKPTITGTASVGSTLAASASSPDPGVTFSYQWYADGSPIAGESWQELRVTDEHVGARLSVRVWASATNYHSATATSEETAAVTYPHWADVSRLAGPDRYATSVAVSQAQFAPGVDAVYIASGTDFPDALSGAPVAGLRKGPLLLTPSWGLPQVVIDEITRLRPKTAIIFGGPAVVGPGVEAQLEALTGGRPARFAGADRYATSVAIARMEHAATAPSVVYIANGGNFPDALAGAPLAGLERGALLLAQTNALPSVIADELARMRPGRIVILGGPASISTAVEAQLAAYTSGGVTRLAGADRYDTSVAISEANFASDVPVAYIASGGTFPDALSGAPVAAITRGPVLLTPADGLPDSVIAELQRLRPERIVILGGTATIGTGVAATLEGLY